MAGKITVKAKTDAGFHPVHGMIVKGASYTMDESQWGDQLFERPSADWKAPWELEAEAAAAAAQGPETAQMKGGK